MATEGDRSEARSVVAVTDGGTAGRVRSRALPRPPMRSTPPALPMLRIDPALPILRMLPALPMLSTLPILPMLRMLPALRRLRMLSTLPTLIRLNRLRADLPRVQGGRPRTSAGGRRPKRPRARIHRGVFDCREASGRDGRIELSPSFGRRHASRSERSKSPHPRSVEPSFAPYAPKGVCALRIHCHRSLSSSALSSVTSIPSVVHLSPSPRTLRFSAISGSPSPSHRGQRYSGE